MMKGVDPAQTERIFQACDRSSRGKITLEELQRAMEKGKRQK